MVLNFFVPLLLDVISEVFAYPQLYAYPRLRTIGLESHRSWSQYRKGIRWARDEPV
jgi:hypothetical protein